MKKLFVLSAVALFTLFSTTTFAQVEGAAVEAPAQDKSKIDASKLPEAVTKALAANYPDFTVLKAAKILKQNTASLKNEAFFNVKLTNKEEKIVTALFDAKGNEIKDDEEEKKE